MKHPDFLPWEICSCIQIVLYRRCRPRLDIMYKSRILRLLFQADKLVFTIILLSVTFQAIQHQTVLYLPSTWRGTLSLSLLISSFNFCFSDSFSSICFSKLYFSLDIRETIFSSKSCIGIVSKSTKNNLR